MKWTLRSDTSLAELAKNAGGKATNLGRLTKNGLLVPTWFSVSVEAFDEFIRANQFESLLLETEDAKAQSLRIEAAFLKATIPEGLKQAIESDLTGCGLQSSYLAIRSSGVAEDSAGHSFAGQFSSFLFQKGWDQISESLKRCWASGFSERVLAYRKERGLRLEDNRVGVVIQKMVDATSAGVAFSRHPIKVLDRNLVLVSSVWGLGEGLVSGELDSDDFEVHRDNKTIVKKTIAAKSEAMRQASSQGLEKVHLDEVQGKTSSLTDEQVSEIAQICIKLEELLGSAQDIEWCLEQGKVLLVQTRPITSIPPAAFYDDKVNGKAAVLWDNSNIIESYSGVTTPLTFSFANRAYTQVYIQFCELMGVPQELVDRSSKVYRNMLGLIRGRIYYNLINWYKFIMMLPGSANNRGFMETMMGVKAQVRPEMADIFSFVKDPPNYSFPTKIVLFSKTIWRFLTIDAIILQFQNHFNKIYDGARHQNLDDWSLPQLADHFEHLDSELLKQWKAPIINDYLCMLFFGLLKKLTQQWIVGEQDAESLQNELLCGEGGLDSTEPTKCLMRIADAIDHGDQAERLWFLNTPAEMIWQELCGSKKNTTVANDFKDFLDRFGFRCVNELKLEEFDLHDNPSFVISSVASYVRSKSYAITDMEKREREMRMGAEQKVKAKLTYPKIWLYWWILKQARRAVKNRENLRFARTKVFGVCRHLFRAMGRKLTTLGFLDNEHDVFYLTVEELLAFIEGRPLITNLRGEVLLRKTEFDEYRDTSAPPDRILTIGAVGPSLFYPAVLSEGDMLRSEPSENDDPMLLRGTPCCPGIIEGIVRVVDNVKDAEGMNGEILVTGRTDPGWVPLYPSCGGLLIERGSLLSHSAVVARELGLPTIVGISGGLMTRLKSGQRVRVDAGKGEIRILSDK